MMPGANGTASLRSHVYEQRMYQGCDCGGFVRAAGDGHHRGATYSPHGSFAMLI